VVNRWEDTQRPFHAPSQPGDGLDVLARGVDSYKLTIITARLTAVRTDGSLVERIQEVPVRINPFK
jgi:hypothetical protein